MLDRDVRNCVLAVAAVALCAYVALYSRIALEPIHSDGYSYYVYLPAWFIYHDPSFESLAKEWFGGTFPSYTGMFRWPSTGRFVDLHPIGTAVSMSPFFVAAHLLTRWSNLPPDGFSLYYQHAAALAAIAYSVAGLALVGVLLSEHFSGRVVIATLVCLMWGTNLFHYTVYDGTFSHAFSFFLIAAWLLEVDRWWREPMLRRSLALGALGALIVVTRHTNAIFLVILPLYGVSSWRDLQARAIALWQRRRALALLGAVFAAGLLPQLAVYRIATGSWFVSAYSGIGAGFTFRTPHVFGVLFSTQRGLFFWSPILALAVVGVLVARGWARGLAAGAAIVFALDTFLIASWWDWQFGESYGHRGFTDGFAVAAPFIAASFDWAGRRRAVSRVVPAIAVLAVSLSVVQMIQYWLGIMPTVNLTWDQYRAVFLRFR